MRKKVQLVRERGYVKAGYTSSLTSYFAVPKAQGDIRMVYDATKSGLNASIWAPNFLLPTIDSMTRLMDHHSWMGDLDLADMFLNFPLDPKIRPLCGIDLRPLFPDATSWGRWERCVMGLKSSPYVTIKALLLAFEIVLGDHQDPHNVFHWTEVKLNLPGAEGYDPTKPRVWKHNPVTGQIAASVIGYVDDLRALGSSAAECWRALNRTGSVLSYLGIQVAARKTRAPSKTPGPWAGSIAWATPSGISVRSPKDKWAKAKLLVGELQQELDAYDAGDQPEGLDFKRLESARGFLVHMQRTYPSMTPYLKGVHLTLDSWRPARDREGWKQKSWIGPEGYWSEELDQWQSWDDAPASPPSFVFPVPRYSSDLSALLTLLEPEEPPLRYVRGKLIHIAYYGFVDASGTGFGSTIQTRDGLAFTYGQWGRDIDSESSNFRELGNLVSSLEHQHRMGYLRGSEILCFTDNSTAESVFYKGNTSSPRLFDLVLRLRRLEMTGSTILHVHHVAGTRMVHQGTDGLSRGDMTEGVMNGRSMLSFVPLDQGALERRPEIVDWIRNSIDSPSINTLTPSSWFTEGHGLCGGNRSIGGLWVPVESDDEWLVWSPPPAIADIAIEEIAISRHKRPHLNHLFIAPRLHTQTWRKRLHKLSDVVFEIPTGRRSFWPHQEHEPLVVGLILHFSSCSPWQLKQDPAFLALAGKLRSVWEAPEGSEWHLLRQLSTYPRTLESL